MNQSQTRSGRLNFDEASILAIALDAHWITTRDLRAANGWRYKIRPQIGQLALNYGILTMANVFRILEEQAENGGMFGDTAIALGLLDKQKLHDLLVHQVEQTPSLLEAFCSLGVITSHQAEELKQLSEQELRNACSSIVV